MYLHPQSFEKSTSSSLSPKFSTTLTSIGAIDVKVVENFGLNDEEVDFSKD